MRSCIMSGLPTYLVQDLNAGTEAMETASCSCIFYRIIPGQSSCE